MKVSIVIPTYNSEKYIRPTIDSVLSQTHRDIECVVVDGGSKDTTLEILKSYGERIIFISEKDKGVFDGLNKGIKMASGEVIGWLGSDDVYAHDHVVERAAKELTEKNVDICWGDMLYVQRDDLDKTIRFWRSSPYKEHAYRRGWQMPHFASFVRKKIFDAYGYFSLDYPISADYEFFLRIMEIHKISSSYIPEVFSKMRTGGQSNLSLKGNLECYRAWGNNNLKVNPLGIFLPNIYIKLTQYIRKS